MLLLLLLLLLLTIVVRASSSSSCPPGTCRQYSTTCVVSQETARCDSCNNAGYLNSLNECVCYSRFLDPASKCRPPHSTNSTYVLNYTATYATCECGNSDATGYFKPVSSSVKTKYGAPLPPTCSECLTDAFGPPPGAGFDACNSFGSPDPNAFYTPERDVSWRVCSGHGAWNPAKYSCDCYFPWVLNYTGGIGRNPSERVRSCIACLDGYGPAPPISFTDENEPLDSPYCRSIWTIDPTTGLNAECSGHGKYNEGSCNCYTNGTTQWNLFEVLPGVSSCFNATNVTLTN